MVKGIAVGAPPASDGNEKGKRNSQYFIPQTRVKSLVSPHVPMEAGWPPSSLTTKLKSSVRTGLHRWQNLSGR